MVVVTFSGVPRVGGMVICGRTAWILLLTKVSFTREVIRLDLPQPSSPQTHILTVAIGLDWRTVGGTEAAQTRRFIVVDCGDAVVRRVNARAEEAVLIDTPELLEHDVSDKAAARRLEREREDEHDELRSGELPAPQRRRARQEPGSKLRLV